MNNELDKKGFTLIELIIALAVFSVGIMAAFTLALAGLNTSKDNYARILSANLAREGIELVRNIRDSNWLKIEDNYDCDDDDTNGIQLCSWNKGLYNGYYKVDYIDDNLFELAEGIDFNDISNYRLNYGEGTFDHQSSDNLTNMARMIEIKDICLNSDEAESIKNINDNSCEDVGETTIGKEVTSRVYWELLGKTHYIDVKEKLYNWKRW